jgi:hypothetical protein
MQGGSSSSGLEPAADGSGAVWNGDLIVEVRPAVSMTGQDFEAQYAVRHSVAVRHSSAWPVAHMCGMVTSLWR